MLRHFGSVGSFAGIRISPANSERQHYLAHSKRKNTVICQAPKTEASERPVMEQLESDLIAGASNGNGNGLVRRNKAPTKNSATNIADKVDTRPVEASTDDEADSGAQSPSDRSGKKAAKAASKVPGGVTEADNISAPKPASFWLPHPEPGDFVPVQSPELERQVKAAHACFWKLCDLAQNTLYGRIALLSCLCLPLLHQQCWVQLKCCRKPTGLWQLARRCSYSDLAIFEVVL